MQANAQAVIEAFGKNEQVMRVCWMVSIAIAGLVQPKKVSQATGEVAKWLMEGDEFLLGGIELHARIVQKDNKPGMDFIYEPIARDLEIPAGIAEYSGLIEKMCRQIVENFPDPMRRGRFYREVKKDGARNRCWYRSTVTSR